MKTNLPEDYCWNFSQKLLFRFLSVYLFLYSVPDFLLKGILWNSLIPWTGKHILGIFVINLGSNGSGDTTYNYVQVFCILILAISCALIWSAIDRKRKNYDKLLYWVLVYTRYYLATMMLVYGIAKIIPTQFIFPSLARLVQPLGESSPMGLAWNFMGYSAGFTIFTGLAEALGGFLLFFRRTSTFGALISITVLSNVVAINFFYDVPVKLFSAHLLLMAIAIVLPDIPRLIRFFFSNKDVSAKKAPPVELKKWMRTARIIIKSILIIAVVGTQVRTGLKNKKMMAELTNTPLDGIYEVSTFERNNQLIPPLTTDSTRWDLLIIDWNGYATVKMITGELRRHQISIDTLSRKIKWENTTSLTYEETGENLLTIKGRIINDSVTIRFRKKDPREFTLVNRGFRWINEYPFNR